MENIKKIRKQNNIIALLAIVASLILIVILLLVYSNTPEVKLQKMGGICYDMNGSPEGIVDKDSNIEAFVCKNVHFKNGKVLGDKINIPITPEMSLLNNECRNHNGKMHITLDAEPQESLQFLCENPKL